MQTQRGLASNAAERLFGDFPRAVLSKQTLHEAAADGLTGIDQEFDARFRHAAEQRLHRRRAEILRDDCGDLGLAAAHAFLGRRAIQSAHIEQRFTREICGNGVRHGTLVFVDQRNGNLSRCLGRAVAPEYIAKKGRNENWHHDADDERAPIGQVQAQVVADQRSDGDGVHACGARGPSRKACPVKEMNTSSRLACAVRTDAIRWP